MRDYADGSKAIIRRAGAGYEVEHITPAGNVADVMACDNFAEARAALHYGPGRW